MIIVLLGTVSIMMPIIYIITEFFSGEKEFNDENIPWLDNVNPLRGQDVASHEFHLRESLLGGDNLYLVGQHLQVDKMPSHKDGQYINISFKDDLPWLSARKLYAAYGCATPRQDFNYAFYLPLTALAWERIGFESVILIAGSKSEWDQSEAAAYILRHLEERKCIVKFIESNEMNQLSISQIARLFAYKFDTFADNDYIVTSDADVWPLEKDFFVIPARHSVLSTNAFCCGHFTHKDRHYRMRPMVSIGSYTMFWKAMMETEHNMSLPASPDSEDMLSYFHKEFGDMVYKEVTKGENDGWYLDQRMISVRLQQFAENHGTGSVVLVPRTVGIDRIDRSGWDTHTLRDKKDVHLLDNGHLPATWLEIRRLLDSMYGAGTPELLWAEEYRRGFLKLISNLWS